MDPSERSTTLIAAFYTPVQGRRGYDFVLAIKEVDAVYASAYQVYVDTKLEEDDAPIPTLYDTVERFRNHLRLNRATTKSYRHTAFATLQGKDPAELAADSAALSKPKKIPACLCGETHWYSKCRRAISHQAVQNQRLEP